MSTLELIFILVIYPTGLSAALMCIAEYILKWENEEVVGIEEYEDRQLTVGELVFCIGVSLIPGVNLMTIIVSLFFMGKGAYLEYVDSDKRII